MRRYSGGRVVMACSTSRTEAICSSTRSLIVLRKIFLQRGGIFHDHIENASLSLDPTFIAMAKKTVEEPIGQHLGRKRAIEACPAHVSLNAFAE